MRHCNGSESASRSDQSAYISNEETAVFYGTMIICARMMTYGKYKRK